MSGVCPCEVCALWTMCGECWLSICGVFVVECVVSLLSISGVFTVKCECHKLCVSE